MDYRDFVAGEAARRRYWTRSFIGWPRFGQARPNPAHEALARLEQRGRLSITVTQNVDGLQQRAGSRQVVELHGSLAQVVCLSCEDRMPRAEFQQLLLERNAWLSDLEGELAPDGDARVAAGHEEHLDVPACGRCGGVMKPDVVFFGESVPPPRVQSCRQALAASDAVLIAGSSLMVYSGFRFVREASALGLPVAAVNLGKTRADNLLQHKFEADCAEVLPPVADLLAPR